MEFIVSKGVVFDRLYISKKDWESDFREYGLVSPGYKLTLRLDEVITHTGGRVKLYSKRDVRLS